jgi:signal transduction histidine kinase
LTTTVGSSPFGWRWILRAGVHARRPMFWARGASHLDQQYAALQEVVAVAAQAPTTSEPTALLARLATVHQLSRLDIFSWDSLVRDTPTRQQRWSGSDVVASPESPEPPNDLDVRLRDNAGREIGFARISPTKGSQRRAAKATEHVAGEDLLVGALTILLERQLALRNMADDRRRTVQAFAELTDHRQRTAAAMDQTRRSLEQDLHDGAQGDLVALGMRVRLRRNLSASDLPPDLALPEPAMLLREAHALRDRIISTAAGLIPARLVEGGIAAALRHELPAETLEHLDIHVGEDLVDRRFPPAIEAAVYFICAEAVVNARKHAPGADIRIEVSSTYRGVDVKVTDTGPGFNEQPGPSAFRALRERTTAVGGTLDVTSLPETGTRVCASIPC